MPLVKTEPGREALQRRDRSLSPRERQILVITDGSRTRSQLLDLLGLTAAAPVDRLLQLGYLQSQEKAPAVHMASPDSAPQARRSLVATKVYCVDMLQLIREPQAAAVVRALQSSLSETELIHNVWQCLRYLQQNTTPSYAAKVGARLAEIVPPQHLEQLAQCRAECLATPAPVQH
ncbi:hypothetical protein [Variovorax sp. HJSM1_2]|uniref:hypothetical protein n=1 Tax=Variovorax sp. HJSM1_2 TaxID=3366263 RepID=UPI003BBEE272